MMLCVGLITTARSEDVHYLSKLCGTLLDVYFATSPMRAPSVKTHSIKAYALLCIGNESKYNQDSKTELRQDIEQNYKQPCHSSMPQNL